MKKTRLNLSGRIWTKGIADSFGFRSFVEKEIFKWVFSKFPYSPCDVQYFTNFEREEDGQFVGCELEIHVDSDVFRAYETSRTVRTGIRKCLRRMRRMTREPVGLELHETVFATAAAS